jgi:hypothetical protein
MATVKAFASLRPMRAAAESFRTIAAALKAAGRDVGYVAISKLNALTVLY